MKFIQKVMLFFVVRDQRRMIKKLRDANMLVEAQALEESLKTLIANPNRSMEQVIQDEKLKLIRQGKHEKALEFEEIAESVIPVFRGVREMPVVLNSQDLKPMPTTWQSFKRMFYIGILSFLFAFSIAHFGDYAADLSPDQVATLKTAVLYFWGGLLALSFWTVYVCWLLFRAVDNYRKLKNRPCKKD
ncbi:hypothetical protein [Undibacterium danionis]|uniref:Uncharacterized protein n=1 Tax=Undibacterium danionis TaxID=1812100 RepID=A0ABV6IDT8_9BURK